MESFNIKSERERERERELRMYGTMLWFLLGDAISGKVRNQGEALTVENLPPCTMYIFFK